ncbi:uncharacterized protein NECHADRAFT_78360 [Fusarium vanettenii 77-13-4]|uniref:Uncharacterized protein n=1 Tax=Fusarium vanettenii (strain ATCC MYA-4622 / CBS 123669 / FGSC 9596 / NRRL 45880 / 77-13-4) TaxID=660122 RepID=C7ZFL0_FUSV7|nr:uncharacterized protein NECHADRAFT_78360 [Fusarium vanettenii 77-13-4]EEU37262.1 hypothetical protein NECHADRAFT_78360 [Fusarium vanettenii 77-13-4]
MPPPQTRTPLQRSRDLEIAKRQFTFLVSITATIFILCPECLRIYRNLCIVPALAWLTGFAFDLINSLSNTLDNAPTLLKYFIPDMNIPITAPFDQICTSVGPIISKASSYARLMALEAKARIVALRQVVLLVLANWFLRQLGLDPIGENSGRESEDGAPGPAPISDRWFGLLVMTPPVHDYGSLPLDPKTSERSQPIPWDSHETSSIPSISPPSDFRVHLSFCLVPKTIWESPETTLAEKLKAGLYWDMRGEDCGSDGEIWAQARVQRITGIEILGLVDEEQDTVNACHAYFASLQQDWKYMKISWNDVDFAIILGFLNTGPQVTQRMKELFACFSRLRINQALAARANLSRKGFLACWCVSATAGAVTFLTGGLAAPITGPLFVGGCFSGLGVGLAGDSILAHDMKMWKRRIEGCQDLQRRFPQLEEIFQDEG